MPFKSEKQRKWMHANDPDMADEWEKKKKKEGNRMSGVVPLDFDMLVSGGNIAAGDLPVSS